MIPGGAAAQVGRRDRRQRSAAAGSRDLARRRARSAPAASTFGPATTSCAAISRSGRSPRCTSRFRTTRRRIRRPTTTPGWTFQLMRDLRIVPGHRQGVARSADDAGHARRQGARRHRRHGPRCSSSSTPPTTSLVTFRFRNAGVRMLAAEEDFDLAGRRFRAGSIIDPRRATAHALEPIAARPRALGVGGATAPAGQDATSSMCRASATCTAGRGPRTRAGGAPRSTPTACRTPTSPIRSCAKATCGRSTT